MKSDFIDIRIGSEFSSIIFTVSNDSFARDRSFQHLAIDTQPDAHNGQELELKQLLYIVHQHDKDSRSAIEFHRMKSRFHHRERDREWVLMFLAWLHDYSDRNQNHEDEQVQYRSQFLNRTDEEESHDH